MSKSRTWGMILVIAGATLWGVGGTMSQYLFQYERLPVGWYVSVRLLVSGILLLGISAITQGKAIIGIWSNKYSALQIVIYAVFGMLAVQYTFMASIHYGNVTVATLLQYLGLIIIMIYLVVSKQIRFQLKELIAVILALSGSYLLLTNGSTNKLSISWLAIIWGLASSVALAFYTVYPVKLLARWGAVNVVGWAMFIGGVFLSVIYHPWEVDISLWSPKVYIFLIVTIIFGTMLAFWLYIESLNYLSPQETSLFGTIEPLTALIVSVIWLGDTFGRWQIVGVSIIIFMVCFISLYSNKDVT
ncbi:DMT family transporter [Staphylococcus sp. SQ8-PEA]|uniref:DMT family transporter n=1 Tax=Staphylococcus marylandisciuri TaxID=2981529 RepID=A0ABT2QMT2_9STAP|nr:DMT family transporter [Staphylococcus marylandisciuri]MCU5745282.1 DMT family transporter [Staphylococcus marylandisciuri]